ncbi:hypothetical protein EDC04DRAFT_2549588, partial [Pisolithus marmoratus]
FMVATITSLYSSPFAEGFNIGQHQAAIWALLRYGAHEDGMHHHTKSPDGLHPAYAAFNPTDNKVIHRMDLVEALLGDIFDVITLQDCLDGRLSILVRCPGSDSTVSAEKLAVDVYVTPHKVLGYKCVCGDSAMLLDCTYLGAPENHQQHVSNVHMTIHSHINCQLCKDVTGDPKVKMQWVQYFQNVI